ncbi:MULTISPECIES: hypothetical protein [unclassified Pseudoalteromonas]|uniref:hypothetical protein n=1 Tax=unclassified Pseudoalteromonas TaxID=194690 RepID=UPI0019CF4CE5|nr:hypothetical protein [Pseudoalteromonas sp. JC3]MBR8843231.1 hypothetical protein [Pseudoalteromonas sp. JC3]WJE09348.1 hypothetical protein QSH61_02430 [Pseudoalteromonas sp. JC3]
MPISMRVKLAVCLFAFASCLPAYSAMPKSQIWLAELGEHFSAKPITENTAYFNQPLVTDSGVFYTGEVSADGNSQTDLFFYDFQSQNTTNLTQSPVSEYSPTLHPNGKGLTTIVVEGSGKQKLWFYPFDQATKPSRVFEHIEPVGYHAWGSNQDLIMFILGATESAPHTLQYTDINGHLPQILAEDIGRTLSYNRARDVFAFTYQVNGLMWFATYHRESDHIQRFFALPSQVQDYTWLDDNKVAYALDNKIYYRDLNAPKKVHLLRNLRSYCQTSISRLSFFDNKLAFVCYRQD